eukprot:TRINITY_DN7051_c0_g1_i2.p1 TRINITY_DN7051_c0_g1~~TRINITY_DN7051_c0_g1_i2.p1  ORF type:complete len:216 (-),score=46.69 TRINITY_DN7051_c0_g1_i2:7-654(-)
MTLYVRDELLAQSGKAPHVIINNLARIKLDPNREIDEAACGVEEAEEAFLAYHGFIEQARLNVSATYGKGLYVDMHGQSHAEDWQEFGYLLVAGELARSDSAIEPLVNETSIRSIANTNGDFPEILRGATSLGGLVEAAGYRSVPSPSDPSPGTGGYFSGGYSTERWGSFFGGTIDGVQLEMGMTVRRTTDQARRDFARDFAAALIKFMDIHYGL